MGPCRAPASIKGLQERNIMSENAKRNLRLVSLANLSENLGGWIVFTVQTWVAYELTGTAFGPFFMSVLALIPRLAFSLYSPTIASRLSNKVLVVASTLYLSGSSFLLGALMHSGHMTYLFLVIIRTIEGIVAAAQGPVRNEYLRDLVGAGEPQIRRGLALSMASSLAGGASAIGLCLWWINGDLMNVTFDSDGEFASVFLANSLMQLIAGIALAATHPVIVKANTRIEFEGIDSRPLVDTWRVIQRYPLIQLVMALEVVNISTTSTYFLLPGYLTELDGLEQARIDYMLLRFLGLSFAAISLYAVGRGGVGMQRLGSIRFAITLWAAESAHQFCYPFIGQLQLVRVIYPISWPLTCLADFAVTSMILTLKDEHARVRLNTAIFTLRLFGSLLTLPATVLAVLIGERFTISALGLIGLVLYPLFWLRYRRAVDG